MTTYGWWAVTAPGGVAIRTRTKSVPGVTVADGTRTIPFRGVLPLSTGFDEIVALDNAGRIEYYALDPASIPA